MAYNTCSQGEPLGPDLGTEQSVKPGTPPLPSAQQQQNKVLTALMAMVQDVTTEVHLL